MHATDDPRTTLTGAVDALRHGLVDPASYLEGRRERFAAVESEVRAFVAEEDRWARLAGAAASGDPDPTDPRPPLRGVPVGIKDVLGVEGLPTRAGTDLPAAAFEGSEATVVSRLRAAGAVPLGKTVTAEFAYFAPGPTRNPHDPSHTPGGSSSGSAAAVAAGLCPLAVGTQTAGSVVRPAAFCGVVGFKPSAGRVPVDGLVPVSPTLDQVGVFTRDVAGAALAAAVCCDDWATVPDPDAPPALGVPGEAYLDRAGPVGRERFEAHLDRLAAAGFRVERTDALADVGALAECHRTLMAGEMALVHRERGWYPDHADRYAPETRELVEAGDATPAADLGAARAARAAAAERLADRTRAAGVDCWVSPAAPGPAPAGLDDTGDPIMNLPWTAAGVPAITLPVDRTDGGLPLGLQCAAPRGRDEDLLGWASRIGAAFGLDR